MIMIIMSSIKSLNPATKFTKYLQETNGLIIFNISKNCRFQSFSINLEHIEDSKPDPASLGGFFMARYREELL